MSPSNRISAIFAILATAVSSATAQLTPDQTLVQMGTDINLGNTLEPPTGGAWNNGPAEQHYFELGVYPNPLNDVLQVAYDGALRPGVHAEMVSALGQRVLQFYLLAGVERVSVGTFPSGHFFLRVYGGGRVLASSPIVFLWGARRPTVQPPVR